MSKLTKEQIALLRKVKKAILDVPERLVMGLVFKDGLEPGISVSPQTYVMQEYSAGNPYESHDRVPPCGSVGCIQGWAEHFDKDLADEINLDWLISAGSWPKNLATQYRNADTAKKRAALAGMAIDHFIEHDGGK